MKVCGHNAFKMNDGTEIYAKVDDYGWRLVVRVKRPGLSVTDISIAAQDVIDGKVNLEDPPDGILGVVAHPSELQQFREFWDKTAALVNRQ